MSQSMLPSVVPYPSLQCWRQSQAIELANGEPDPQLICESDFVSRASAHQSRVVCWALVMAKAMPNVDRYLPWFDQFEGL